jgi:hypothetical protein
MGNVWSGGLCVWGDDYPAESGEVAGDAIAAASWTCPAALELGAESGWPALMPGSGAAQAAVPTARVTLRTAERSRSGSERADRLPHDSLRAAIKCNGPCKSDAEDVVWLVLSITWIPPSSRVQTGSR